MLRPVLLIGPVIAIVSLGIAILGMDASRGKDVAAQVVATSTPTRTVTPNSASVSLTASPAAIICDGVHSSVVSAKVTDAQGDNVVDGTPVSFSVVALGTSNPSDTFTVNGSASSVVTPFAGSTAGVTVVVMSGLAQASIRIDCVYVAPTATATPPSVEITLSTKSNSLHGFAGTVTFPVSPPANFSGAVVRFSKALSNVDYVVLVTPVERDCIARVTDKRADGFRIACDGLGGSVDFVVITR